MHTQFDFFNLESGTPLPRFKSMAFFAAVYRAKNILREISFADVRAIAASLPKVKHLPNYVDPLYDTLTKWNPMPYMDPQGVVSDAVPSTSDVSAFVKNIGRVDASMLVTLSPKSCNWQFVFATMALLYVDEALRLQHDFDERSKSRESKSHRAELAYLSEVAECAIAATEAVTAAELGKPSLIEQVVIEEHIAFEALNGILVSEKQKLQANLEHVKNQRKSNARKGGLAKNAPIRELVAEFIRFYDTPGRPFKSNRQAVDQFLSTQKPERLAAFSRDNIKRTLLDWLRKIKKGTRVNLPTA